MRENKRYLEATTRSRLNVLGGSGRGSSSTGPLLGLQPAVLPRRSDKVDPDEDISGKQHAEDELEEEDEFSESLSVDGDEGRNDGSGGNTIVGNIRPLPGGTIVIVVVPFVVVPTVFWIVIGRRLVVVAVRTTLKITLDTGFGLVVGPALIVRFALTGIGGELVALNAGLLLFYGLFARLNLALFKAA